MNHPWANTQGDAPNDRHQNQFQMRAREYAAHPINELPSDDLGYIRVESGGIESSLLSVAIRIGLPFRRRSLSFALGGVASPLGARRIEE